MTLMLHVNASQIDYDGLRQLETPEGTNTHVPIPHFRFVDMVAHSLAYFGHEVVAQHHGVTEDGMRYFGLLSLRSPYTGYEDTLGLRNSHDKTIPLGIAFGSRVFVCDNMAFIADHVVKRKHTAKALRDLPYLVSQLVEPLAIQREQQKLTFDRYQGTEVSDELADLAIMRMYRGQIINVTRIAEVVEQWERPTHDWGDKTAFRLFNAATFALTGRVSEKPSVTSDLHKIIDGVCERVHG